MGDRLISEEGLEVRVEGITDTGRFEKVYNLRVAENHTYYVGSAAWGFDVWVHNTCVYIARKGNVIIYIGITDHFPVRKAYHRLFGRDAKQITDLGDLLRHEARAVEQALIEKVGFIKDKTGTLENLINSIARSNPFYQPAKIIAAQLLARIRIL